MIKDLKKHKLFLSLTLISFFLSFTFNVFGAVSTDSFIMSYKDSEALVANQVRCEGRLYADQMLEKKLAQQSVTACNEASFLPYSSQFGLQGKLYTLGYRVVSGVTGIGVGAYVVIAQFVTAALSAAMFALLVVWVRSRVGFIPAVLFSAFVAISPMLVGFGRNLYWSLPLFLLPLVYMLYFYTISAPRSRKIWFWVGLGFIMYVRYLCGYEYITTITIMLMSVVVYYLYLNKSKLGQYLQQIALAGAVSAVAFIAALATHLGTLSAYTGSISRSVEVIKQRAQERTLNADSYLQYPYANLQGLAIDHYRVTDSYVDYQDRKQSNSKIWAGIVAASTYLLLPVIHLPFGFSTQFALYAQSMAAFLAVLTLLFVMRNRWMAKKKAPQIQALFLAAAVGLVGYCSWLALAYSHSLVHAHINGILMYLPCALFGFMLIGLCIESRVPKLAKKYDK